MHDGIHGQSAQQAIKSGRAPRPQVGSMQHDAEGDMAPDAQTQSKNDPLAHHVNQLGMQPDEKERALPKEGELGGRGFGRFDFRRGNQTGQVIRHKVQRLFTTVSAAALFTTLHR